MNTTSPCVNYHTATVLSTILRPQCLHSLIIPHIWWRCPRHELRKLPRNKTQFNQLTIQRWTDLEKLTVSQLLNKFPTFCRTLKFITMTNGPYPEAHELSPHPLIFFLKIHSNIILPSMPRSSSSLLQGCLPGLSLNLLSLHTLSTSLSSSSSICNLTHLPLRAKYFLSSYISRQP